MAWPETSKDYIDQLRESQAADVSRQLSSEVYQDFNNILIYIVLSRNKWLNYCINLKDKKVFTPTLGNAISRKPVKICRWWLILLLYENIYLHEKLHHHHVLLFFVIGSHFHFHIVKNLSLTSQFNTSLMHSHSSFSHKGPLVSITSSYGQFSKLLSAQMRVLIINWQVFPPHLNTLEALKMN